MAKITSRAGLIVGTELTIDETLKTFTLNVAGNLIAKDGVTLQALYSKFVELWSTPTYQDSPFPMYAIDAKSGQFQFGTDGASFSGWKPANDTTRQRLRDGGWSEFNTSGTLARQYVGIVTLGTVSLGSQLYFQKTEIGTATNFTFNDAANEGIQVYGDIAADSSTTTFDSRTFFKGYVREQGKKYKDSVLADTGQTATGAFLVNLLLSNEDDLDITDSDANVSTLSPYTQINVKYFATTFSRDIDLTNTPRDFGIVVDVGTHSGVDGVVTNGGSTLTTAAGGITGATYTGGVLSVFEGGTLKANYPISGTPTATVITITGSFPAAGSGLSFTIQRPTPVVASLKQIYTKIQYLLRQNSDIDATGGVVTGKTASLLLNFVGPDLKAGAFFPSNSAGGGSGVLVQGLANADLNTVTFYDNTTAQRLYPFSSAWVISFNAPLVGVGSSFRMMFTAPPGIGNDYGESGAITVNDASGNPITGIISSGQLTGTYDYDGNTQGGFAGGTDRPITLVAIRPGFGKFVAATSTLTRSKSIAMTLTAEQDRAYL